MERVISYKKLSELTDVGVYLKRLSGTDMDNVPAKYGTSLTDAVALMENTMQIAIVSARCAILEKTENTVTLEGGITLTGELAPKVLKEAKELVAFVLCMQGFGELKTDDIMVEYFADSLASAYVECAEAHFANDVQEMLQKEGMKRTHLWCPGQHKFDLVNQTPLFELLDPSEIGCKLSSRLMMVPVKAASGIFGVVAPEVEELLRPCDYCHFKKTCPGSDKGCAVI